MLLLQKINCPKCGKSLHQMNKPHLAYCKKKIKVDCFGEQHNRKFRLEEMPDSGCGTLFLIPIKEVSNG